jgi:hypothetical protein
MATEKQIAANRANARRSTGPKTLAGRMKSSRNAYRHGLSCPMPTDLVTAEKLEGIAGALTDESSGAEQQQAAIEFARAQLERMRIAQVRNQLLLEIDFGNADLEQLKRLTALDRYDRFADTARRRACRRLEGELKGELKKMHGD